MDIGGRERRGIFGGLRVPFSMNALILAFGGYLVFRLAFMVLGGLMDEGDLPRKLFSQGIDLFPVVRDILFGLLPEARQLYVPRAASAPEALMRLSPLDTVWCLLVVAAVWAFLGAAIGRIAALKIARDESLGLSEALSFARRKFSSNLISLVAIGAFVVFFNFLCNGVLAGWAGRIPYVGEVLVAVLYPLVLLSSFIVILLFYLTIFGVALIPSAIATESSESFDGISRAFNYVYSRPWDVILLHTMTFVFMGLFYYLAVRFQVLAIDSVFGHSVSWLGMGDKFIPVVKLVRYGYSWSEAMGGAQGWVPFTGAVLFVLFWVVRAFVWSYLVAYWFCAGTTMYFVLRRDVEGEEYEEIYLEDEDEDLDSLLAGPVDAQSSASGGGEGEQAPAGEPQADPAVGAGSGGE